MKQPVERRLAAILAADVAGYSRLMGQDEAGTHERLRAVFREVVDPRIKEHRGRVVKNTGDGMLVEFARRMRLSSWLTRARREPEFLQTASENKRSRECQRVHSTAAAVDRRTRADVNRVAKRHRRRINGSGHRERRK